MIKKLAVLIIFLLETFSIQAQGTDNKINIGAILPLTGEAASIGIELRRGIELALSESRFPNLTVSFEDDLSFNKTVTLAALQRLLAYRDSSIILAGSVNTVKTLSSSLERYKTSGIIIWDSVRTLPEISKNIFGFGYSTEAAGEKMADFLVAKKKIKKIAILSTIDEWSELITKSFRKKAELLNAEIVFSGAFVPEENDYRTSITKAISTGAEAIYAPLTPHTITACFQQIRELGFKGIIATGDSFGENDIKQLGNKAEGIFSTQLWSKNDNLLSGYKKKFGSSVTPINLGFVALGYDSIKLIESVVQSLVSKKISVTRTALLNELHQHKFKGITGEVDFNSGRQSEKDEVVVEVKDRDWRTPQ